MPEIRHMAIAVGDIARSAEFYASVFDMVELMRGETPNAGYAYLSDGELNLAVLHYKSDKMAGIENSHLFTGPHHFGIQVEDLKRWQSRSEAAGGHFHFNLGDEKQGNFESKYRDPNGAIYDISHGGWVGTPTQRVGERLAKTPPRHRPGVAMLRHIAVAVADPEASARFFGEVFGFARRQMPGGGGVADGYVSLALLPSRSDDDFVGPRYIGFQVPDLAAAAGRIVERGGKAETDVPTAGDERFFRDPNGVLIAISQRGWGAPAGV
jgi:lactoylglutathione lyase